MWIKGHYGSNHPKDRSAKKAKELQESIKSKMCTKSEMWRPTEENVRKHVQEQKTTLHDSLELKKTVKVLNKEDHNWGNTERFRPKK